MVGLLVLLLLAAVAFVALRLHRTPRRWVLPACWTVLGLLVALGTVGNQGPAVLFGDLPGAGSPGGGLAVAELGLLLVATGLAAWRGGGVLVLIVLLALNGSARDLPLTPWPPAIPGGQGVVLHLPLPGAGDSTLVLAAGHGRPLASGAGTDDPVSRTLFRIAPVLTRLAHLDETGGEVPENAELAQLRRLGVRELLVDLDRAGPWGAVLEQRLGPGVRDQQWLRLELPR